MKKKIFDIYQRNMTTAKAGLVGSISEEDGKAIWEGDGTVIGEMKSVLKHRKVDVNDADAIKAPISRLFRGTILFVVEV